MTDDALTHSRPHETRTQRYARRERDRLRKAKLAAERRRRGIKVCRYGHVVDGGGNCACTKRQLPDQVLEALAVERFLAEMVRRECAMPWERET